MTKSFSNFFKVYNIFWAIVNFLSIIIFGLSQVIIIAILIAIPVFAIIGIYKIVIKKKSNKVEINSIHKGVDAKVVTQNVTDDIEKDDKLIFNDKDVIYKDEKNVIVKKKYNVGFDIIMTIITLGLWLLWVIFRPKYKNYKIN